MNSTITSTLAGGLWEDHNSVPGYAQLQKTYFNFTEPKILGSPGWPISHHFSVTSKSDGSSTYRLPAWTSNQNFTKVAIRDNLCYFILIFIVIFTGVEHQALTVLARFLFTYGYVGRLHNRIPGSAWLRESVTATGSRLSTVT